MPSEASYPSTLSSLCRICKKRRGRVKFRVLKRRKMRDQLSLDVIMSPARSDSSSSQSTTLLHIKRKRHVPDEAMALHHALELSRSGRIECAIHVTAECCSARTHRLTSTRCHVGAQEVTREHTRSRWSHSSFSDGGWPAQLLEKCQGQVKSDSIPDQDGRTGVSTS